jgi:hypothetical protein
MKRLLWLGPVMLIACSKPAPTLLRSQPTAAPRVVFVVVTPPVTPDSIAISLVPTSVPTAGFQSAEFVVRFPTPRPTVDLAAIPNSDREKEPPPKDLRDQMVRCLTYTVETQDYGPINTRHGVRAFVHARNSCDLVSFDGGDCWFEIHSRDKSGAILSRETGRFQTPIPAKGEATTEIDIMSGFGEKLDASIAWEAGGGKPPGG